MGGSDEAEATTSDAPYMKHGYSILIRTCKEIDHVNFSSNANHRC